MRNMTIEITDEKLAYATKEMGFTFEEAISMMAMTNGITENEVHEILADEARDEEGEYEFETASENAALRAAEYDAETQDCYHRGMGV